MVSRASFGSSSASTLRMGTGRGEGIRVHGDRSGGWRRRWLRTAAACREWRGVAAREPGNNPSSKILGLHPIPGRVGVGLRILVGNSTFLICPQEREEGGLRIHVRDPHGLLLPNLGRGVRVPGDSSPTASTAGRAGPARPRAPTPARPGWVHATLRPMAPLG